MGNRRRQAETREQKTIWVFVEEFGFHLENSGGWGQDFKEGGE